MVTTNANGTFMFTNPNIVGKNVKFIVVTRCETGEAFPFLPCLFLGFDTSNGNIIGQVLNQTTAVTVTISYMIAYTD